MTDEEKRIIRIALGYISYDDKAEFLDKLVSEDIWKMKIETKSKL